AWFELEHSAWMIAAPGAQSVHVELLEVDLQRELHQSRFADGAGHLAEAAIEDVRHRHIEVHVIEGIKDLPAKFQIGCFVKLDRLCQVEVESEAPGPVNQGLRQFS